MGEKPTAQEWKPEPAESFTVDYINTRGQETATAMGKMGFIMRGSRAEGEATVICEGEAQDGTRITIRFEKGANYKSPKELADIAEKEKA